VSSNRRWTGRLPPAHRFRFWPACDSDPQPGVLLQIVGRMRESPVCRMVSENLSVIQRFAFLQLPRASFNRTRSIVGGRG
jgi:hypothetical protein